MGGARRARLGGIAPVVFGGLLVIVPCLAVPCVRGIAQDAPRAPRTAEDREALRERLRAARSEPDGARPDGARPDGAEIGTGLPSEAPREDYTPDRAPGERLRKVESGPGEMEFPSMTGPRAGALRAARSAPSSPISELSAFERQLIPYGDPLVDRQIVQFGYEVFGRAPPEAIDRPVGEDYVLGIGDELVVSAWGNAIDKDFRATIDRAGLVRLPEVGSLAVRGLTMGQAEAQLKRAFDKLYTNYELQVRTGRLREMHVHVVGRVHRPGRVRVLSVASLFDALAAAGGVTKDGSLRSIRVRRRGAEERSVDLYAYLLDGDTTVDVSLGPSDAVVVPAVGPRVAVVGRVLRPAIYELSGDGADLDEILAMAGGEARLANRERFQVESVTREGLAVRTLARAETDAALRRLVDGDVLIVRTANPKLENVVYLAGNVAVPGRYAWREGLRVSDVVTQETLVEAGFWLGRRPPDSGEMESVLPEPFLDYALLRRIDPRSRQERRLAFDLGKAIIDRDPVEDLTLRSQDTIVVFPRSAFEVPRTLFVSGAVNKPGEHRFFPGMKVRDLVRMAGGLLPEAHLSSAVLTRLDPDQAGARFEHIRIDLRAVEAGEERANIALQPDDSLAVKVVPEFRKAIRVTVEGEVRHPGTYTVIPGERLSHLLDRVGGFTEHAYLPATQFYRESTRKLQQRRIEESLRRLELETKLAAQRYVAEAEAAGDETSVAAERERVENLISTIRANPALGRLVIRLRGAADLRLTEEDVELADGDRLVVPRRPQEVHVVGAVFNQTAMLHREGLKVRDYLHACGGPLDTADMEIAYVIRADGSADSAQFARENYRWDADRGRYAKGDLQDLVLYPGDTLVVPYDVKPQVSTLRLATSITQIVFQAALATGVVAALL